MKDKLDKEEKELLSAYEAGKITSIPKKENERYRSYARHTLSKPRNINIRLSERDLERIKVLAAERGLPYQTFISSLLHQVSNKPSRQSIEVTRILK